MRFTETKMQLVFELLLSNNFLKLGTKYDMHLATHINRFDMHLRLATYINVFDMHLDTYMLYISYKFSYIYFKYI